MCDVFGGKVVYIQVSVHGGVLVTRIAKLITDGGDQAVCLPEEFHFAADVEEVFIRKDPDTGDVILSRRPGDWDSYFAVRAFSDVPDDFLSPEKRDQGVHERDPFADWQE